MRVIDFDYNEYFPVEDRELFKRMQREYVSEKEKEFFEQMICKEIYDMPVSGFDVIMHENDNEDGLFIDKCYGSEYKIGRTFDGKTYRLSEYPLNLSEAIACDLYELLGRHITILEWLRERDYKGVRYDYPWEL